VRAASNPPNPWHTVHAAWLGEQPTAQLEVFEEKARSIIAENDSPDVGFRFSINPYRGCFHACSYCYARPTHQYLDWGAGTDFERKIVAKVNAPELLRRELARSSWKGDTIVFSGVTDCYQPLEAVYKLTRRCLEVCLEHRNPVGIVTKGALVRRDAELLGELDRRAAARVFLSIPFADDATARAVEPNAAPPSARFETLAALTRAGVPTGVGLAPVIPGLNDSDIPKILSRARAAGADRAFLTLLRLPAETLPVFEERLQESFPLRAHKILHAIEEVRGGRRNDSRFGSRMHGAGPRWESIERVFAVETRRLGFRDDSEDVPRSSSYIRSPRQPALFDVDPLDNEKYLTKK
jgi:DNA repair photolyase